MMPLHRISCVSIEQRGCDIGMPRLRLHIRHRVADV